MKKEDLGLSENNLKKLEEIEDKILDLDELDDRMDFVDSLVIWSELPEEINDETEGLVDEYLRDYVMNY